MDGFQWALRNIEPHVTEDISSPHALQDQGVQVYFAPMVAPGEKVVNLADGRILQFVPEEDCPEAGYFAEYASLERFCRREGIPLSEVDAQAVMRRAGEEDAAGDSASAGG